MSVTQDFIDEIFEETALVRPTTRRLMVSMMLDLPPDVTLVEDFGIKGPDHYRALNAVMDALIETKGLAGCASALDQAMGNGAQLTELVRTFAPDHPVTFTTLWDVLSGRT